MQPADTPALASPSRFPPLGISDLLILTLTVSVAFACEAPDLQDAMRLYEIGWRDLLPELIDSLVVGLSLFGLIVLARQRIRGDTLPSEPGHIALLALGPFQVVVLLLLGVFRPILMAYWFGERPAFLVADDAFCAVVLIASVVICWRALTPFALRWQVCLALIVLRLLLGIVWSVVDAATTLGFTNWIWRRHVLASCGNLEALTLVACVVTLSTDAIRKISHDWLHYVGIAVVCLNACSNLMHWQRVMSRWWQDVYLHLLP